ncbi:MAG: hypothetical protein IJV97_02655 [Alphaproteobacteria bacterium]|nr:hypothetical protein [Alphaproteobacteria bacterium]
MAVDRISIIENAEWQLWKDDNLVFVKHGVYDGMPAWLIYDAKGEKIAAAETKEYAFWVARQNNLEPYCVN